MKAVTHSMIAGTSWSSCAVRPSWRSSPSTRHCTRDVAHVELGLDPRPERAERVVRLAAGPLPVGLLVVAGGDVVAAGVAEHHVEGPLARAPRGTAGR